ncbi:MFS transporter, partial [Salmonella enterica subsp. enterica serovar Enteritidis]|nr:MFS transporter [Salmonella enterica subsp. enterica serovar Enteritidis]
ADFRPVDHVALWSSHYPDNTGMARIDRDLGIRLSPALSGTDGFYFCALERVPS